MARKITTFKYILATTICLFVILQTSIGQNAKKASSPAAKKLPAGKLGKGTVKAIVAVDMDCSVKINGAAKPLNVKAGATVPVQLNFGENTIEAISADKKSVFKNIIKVQAGETPRVEVSFYANNKFIDYIKEGNVAMVEATINKNPLLATNGGEILASSPIEIAIQSSQLDIIKLLILKGASFTSPTAIFPLHKSILYASSEKASKDKPAPDFQMVEYFLSQGCKITDKDDCGNTPLHSSALCGKLDLLTYLIAKGSDVNAKNDLNDTPLKIAEDKGYISIINVLKPKTTVEKVKADSTVQKTLDPKQKGIGNRE